MDGCTGCSGKIVFFHNPLQPLPRLHRCKKPSKLSTQCECTVIPIGRLFYVQPIAAECWRGNSRKKNTIFIEHPVSAVFGQINLQRFKFGKVLFIYQCKISAKLFFIYIKAAPSDTCDN